jgi:hypothetical protein
MPLYVMQISLVMVCLLGTLSATWGATVQPTLLYVSQDNCKRIRGYSRNDLAGVAKELKVPIDKVSYVKPLWGKGPEGRAQCNMVFNTPKGKTSCMVFNILKTDFIFGQAVPVKGNNAICTAPSNTSSP